MIKIQSCPKTQLRDNEWFTLCTSVKDEINTANADVTKFKSQYDNFNACLVQYDNSLNKLSKSEYTLKSNEGKRKSNASRDGLFNMIRSGLSSSHDDFVAASISLMVVVDQFTNISHLSFEDIIGKTDKIVDYFHSDDYKDQIKLLTLDDRVGQLNTINNDCKQILSKKMTETSRRNIPRKTPITRRELNVAYDELVDELNFLARRDGEADYQTLFSWWNALIDKARTTISLRRGATKGGKTDSGESSRPSTPEEGGGGDRPEIE